jgi:hypothetical protein
LRAALRQRYPNPFRQYELAIRPNTGYPYPTGNEGAAYGYRDSWGEVAALIREEKLDESVDKSHDRRRYEAEKEYPRSGVVFSCFKWNKGDGESLTLHPSWWLWKKESK